MTIPLKAYRDIPVDELAGKVVIDTMNYYPQRDGQIAALDDGSTTSSELLQAHLPQSHVVKGFNNIFFQHLRDLARPRPAGPTSAAPSPSPATTPTPRTVVAEALDALGYDTLDLGPLAEGWRTQPGQPAYGTQYAARRGRLGRRGTPRRAATSSPVSPCGPRARPERRTLDRAAWAGVGPPVDSPPEGSTSSRAPVSTVIRRPPRSAADGSR